MEVLSLAALACAVVPSGAARQINAPSPASSEVATILLRAIGDAKSSAAVVEDQLAALGASAAPELLRALACDGVACLITPELSLRVALRPDIADAIVASLARMPRRAVLDTLERVFTDESLDDGRVAGLRVLSTIGRSEDLPLALRLAQPRARESAADPESRGAFEACAQAVLARDPRATRQLDALFVAAPPELAYALIRALGGLPRDLALEALSELLGRREDSDALALSEIARVAFNASVASDAEVPDAVRRCLERLDVEVAQAAIGACRALEDADSIPGLIPLLGATDSNLAHSARAALRHIARVDFGPDPKAWSDWLERESNWWQSESDAATEALQAGDASQAASSILALGRSRLHRHRAAEFLGAGVARDEPALARMSCGALGDIASPRGIPALKAALLRPEPEVREAARAALQRLERRKAPR